MYYLNDTDEIKVLIDILIKTATGKFSTTQFKEASEIYESIRKYLLTQKDYISFIPEFIRSNNTLSNFWNFIKDKYPTYSERRNYIYQSFISLQDYIDKLNKGEINLPQTNKPTKIFISHSSEDKEYATALVCLLTDLGISNEMILCTSVPVTAIEIGTYDFQEYLKANLINSPLFICLFSQNYINSPMCLCEMGAAWITSKEQRLILTPETNFSLASTTVLGRSHGLKLDDKSGIIKLIEQLNDKFSFSKSYSDIDFIVTRYLKEVDSIKKKNNNN